MLPFRWLVLIAIVLLPLVWALWLTEVVTFSFARLGLSPGLGNSARGSGLAMAAA